MGHTEHLAYIYTNTARAGQERNENRGVASAEDGMFGLLVSVGSRVPGVLARYSQKLFVQACKTTFLSFTALLSSIHAMFPPQSDLIKLQSNNADIKDRTPISGRPV